MIIRAKPTQLWIAALLAALAIAGAQSLAAQDDPLDLGQEPPAANLPEPTPADPADAPLDPISPVPMPEVPQGSDDPTALAAWQLGKELLAEGRAAEAVEQFNKALAKDEHLVNAHLGRALGLKQLGQESLAVKALGKVIGATRDTSLLAQAYFERGEIRFDTRDYDDALSDFEKALELRPAAPELLYTRGRALVRLAAEEAGAGSDVAGETMQSAIRALDHALRQRPDYAEALAERGAAQADLGKYDEAIADLQQAVRLRPEKTKDQYHLGVAHLRRASQGSSAETAKRAEDLRAALAALDGVIASTAANMTDAKDGDAIDSLEVRLARAVTRIELGSLLAAQEQQKTYRGALADCEAVIAERPQLAMAHYHRGVALRLLGENRQAIDAFAQTLRLSPENTEARLRRGIAWFHLGEYDLALNDFRHLGRLPGDPRPSFWIGVVHAQRGEHEEAIRSYTEALNENGRYRLALVNRALAYMQLGSWQRAIYDLNELIQLNPADATAYHRRGLAQQQLGRRAEARQSFEKSQRLGIVAGD